MAQKKRALTGIQASGNLHLGNYLGCIREAIKLQQQYQCLYFIADMHALTTNKDAELLKSTTYDPGSHESCQKCCTKYCI